MESLQFDFKSIENATDKFADYNMLGKGGFGEVYKVQIHMLIPFMDGKS